MGVHKGMGVGMAVGEGDAREGEGESQISFFDFSYTSLILEGSNTGFLHSTPYEYTHIKEEAGRGKKRQD